MCLLTYLKSASKIVDIIAKYMKDIQKSLEYLGFSQKEAKIYLALLELGEASVIGISKKTGIKRTTIYNLLPDMLKNGIVTAAARNQRKIYFVEDPRSLKTDLAEKAKIIDSVLPELAAIQNIIPYKPRITFYEGVGGMKDLYQDTLDSSKSGDTILSFTGLYDFYQYMPKEYSDYYIAERANRKIKIRIIAPKSSVADEWSGTETQDLRNIRIINNKDFHFNADMEIYANKIALISYRENFLGVIIESKEINQMMRFAFELMWNTTNIND